MDNGIGMSKNDLMNCVLRHTTSKITGTKDLLNINSKGFRGEAPLDALSHLEIVTRRKVDDFGHKLKIKGGKYIHVKSLFLKLELMF